MSLVGWLKVRKHHEQIRTIKHQQRLWQKGFYDHQIRDEDDLLSNARYIIANPLRAGLVKDIACYPFWDSTFMK